MVLRHLAVMTAAVWWQILHMNASCSSTLRPNGIRWFFVTVHILSILAQMLAKSALMSSSKGLEGLPLQETPADCSSLTSPPVGPHKTSSSWPSRTVVLYSRVYKAVILQVQCGTVCPSWLCLSSALSYFNFLPTSLQLDLLLQVYCVLFLLLRVLLSVVCLTLVCRFCNLFRKCYC